MYKLFSKLFRNEKSHIFNYLLLLIAIQLVLLLVYSVRGVHGHVIQKHQSFVPNALMISDNSLEILRHKVKELDINEKIIMGNYYLFQNAQVSTFEQSTAIAPQDYGLFAFDFTQKPLLKLACGDTVTSHELLDIYSIKKGSWSVKITPLQCQNYTAELLTPHGRLKLEKFRSNNKFSYFRYSSDPVTDKRFYAALLVLAKQLYKTYYPQTHYLNTNKELESHYPQIHDQMLRTLFSLYFAKSSFPLIANKSAYDLISNYKRVKVNIRFKSEQIDQTMTLLNSLDFDSQYNKPVVAKYLFFGNANSITSPIPSKTFIFFYGTYDRSWFPHARWIEKDNFFEKSRTFAFKLNVGFYIIMLTLMIMLLLFLIAYLKHSYHKYYQEFYLLVLYGYKKRTVTLLLTLMFAVTAAISLVLLTLFEEFMDRTFKRYYIDAVPTDLMGGALFIVGVGLVVFILIFLYEGKMLNAILQGGGRAKKCQY